MSDDRNAKLITVFIMLFLLLNYPMLGIFDRQAIWMGFPVLYFYLFFVWLLAIVAVGLIVKNKSKSN